MAFVTKEWKDRLVEYAGRRKLKNVATGEEIVYDVSRQEGAVSQAGDAFAAETMNNLEQRISDEFDNLNQNLNNGNLSFDYAADGLYYNVKVGADTVRKKCSGALHIDEYSVSLTPVHTTSASINLSGRLDYRDLTADNIGIWRVVSSQSKGQTYPNPSANISYNPQTGICNIQYNALWGIAELTTIYIRVYTVQ